MIKTIFVTLALTLSSLTTYAAVPSQEMANLTRALVHNADLMAKLKKNNVDMMTDYKVTTVKSGVLQYELVFQRSCYCMPLTAKVNILEDMTATYHDGPIKYRANIKFDRPE
jgi:hypothetical protein